MYTKKYFLKHIRLSPPSQKTGFPPEKILSQYLSHTFTSLPRKRIPPGKEKYYFREENRRITSFRCSFEITELIHCP